MPAKPIREDPGSQVPQGPQPVATPQAPPPVPTYSYAPTAPVPVPAAIPAPTYTSTTKDLAKFVMAQGGDPLLNKYLQEARAMEKAGTDFTWGSDWKPISLTNADKPTAAEIHKSVVNYVNSMLEVKPNQKSDVILALSGADLSEWDMNQAAEIIMDEWGIDISTLTNWQRVMGGNEEPLFFTNPQTGQELSLQDAHTALLKNASKWVPALASQLLSGLANADPSTVATMMGYSTTKLEREGKITDVPTRERDLTLKLKRTKPREVLSWLRYVQNEPLLSNLSLREAIFFSTVFSVSTPERQEGVLKILDQYTKAGATSGNVDGINILSKSFALYDLPMDEVRKMVQLEGITSEDVLNQAAMMDTIESIGEYPGAAAIEAYYTSSDPQQKRLGELSNKAIGLFQADADKAAVQGDSATPGMTPIQFMDTFAEEPGGWWGVYMRKALSWENEIAASSEGKASPKAISFINAYRKDLKINYVKLWDGVNSERESINTYAAEHLSLDELLPMGVGKIVDVGQGIYNVPYVHGVLHAAGHEVGEAWDKLVFGSEWGISTISAQLWFVGGTVGESFAAIANLRDRDNSYNYGAELAADWKLGRSIFWHGKGGSSYETGVASVGDAIINQMSPYYQPGSLEEDLIHGIAFGLDLNINIALDPTNLIFFVPVVRNGVRGAAQAQRLIKLAISEVPVAEMSWATRQFKRLAWQVNMNKGISEYGWRVMFMGTGVDIGAVRAAARLEKAAGTVLKVADQEQLYARLGAHLFEQKTASWLSKSLKRLGGLTVGEYEVSTALKAISKNTELTNYESWFFSESQKMFKDRFTSKGLSRVVADKIFQWVKLQKENQLKGLIKLTDEELNASLVKDVNAILSISAGIRPGVAGAKVHKFATELVSTADRGAIDDFYRKVATIREAAGPVHSAAGRLTKAEKAAGVKVTKRTLAVNALKAKIVDEDFWDIGTDLISNKSAVRRADEILAMFHEGSLLAEKGGGQQIINTLPHIAGPIKALHVATARRMGMTRYGSPVIQKIRQLTSDVPTLVADIEGDLGAFMYMWLRRANVHTPAKQAELVAQAAALSLRMKTMKKGSREVAFALFMQNVGTETTRLILEKYNLIDWTKIEKIADKKFLLRGLNDAMTDRTFKTIEEAKQALIDGMYRQVAEKVWHGTLSLNASLYGISTQELQGAIESGQDLVKITARNRTYRFDGSDKVFESLEKAKVAAKQYALANGIVSGVKVHTLDPLFETQLPNMWAMFDPHRLEDTIRQTVGWHESFNQRVDRLVGSRNAPRLYDNDKYRGLLTGKTTTKFVFDQTIKRLVDKVLFLWKFSVVATPRYVLRVPFGDEQLRMMADLGFLNYLTTKKLAALGNHVDTTLRLPLDMGSVKLQESLAASGLNIEEVFDMLLAQETRNLSVGELRQLQQIPTEVRAAMQAQIDGHATRVLNPKHEEVFPTATDGVNIEGDYARIIAAPNPGSEPLTDKGLLESQAGKPGSSSETPLADYEEALATRETQSRGLEGSRVPAHEARRTVATAEQARHQAALDEIAPELSSAEERTGLDIRAIQFRYGNARVTDAVLAAAEGKIDPARLKQLSVFESTLARQAIGPIYNFTDADKAHAVLLMKIVREITGDTDTNIAIQLAKIVEGVTDDAVGKTAAEEAITELSAAKKVATKKKKIADPELEALANSVNPEDPVVQEHVEGLFAEYADVTAERTARFDDLSEGQQIAELRSFKAREPERWAKISKEIGTDAVHAEQWSAYRRLRLGQMDAQFKKLKADLRRYKNVLELEGFNHEAAQARWFRSLSEMIRLNGTSAGTPDDIRDFFRLARDDANRRLEEFTAEQGDLLDTPRTEAMGDDYISDNNGPVADVDRKGATLDQTPTTHLIEQQVHTADMETHGKKLGAYEGFTETARKIQDEIDGLPADDPLAIEFKAFLETEASRVGYLIEKSSAHELVHRFMFEHIETLENESWRKFAKIEEARVFYPDEKTFKEALVVEGEKLRLRTIALKERQDIENTLAAVRQDLTMQPIPWTGLPGELPHDAPIGQLFVFPDRSVGRVEELRFADLIKTQDPALLQADVVTDMKNSPDLQLPFVERTNDGKLYLHDGHHRVASMEGETPTGKFVVRDVESLDPLAKRLVYNEDRFFLSDKDGGLLAIADHPRAGIWESITAFAESRPSLHAGQTLLIDSGELLPEVRELFTEGTTLIGFDLTKADSKFLTQQMITDMTRLAASRKAAGLPPQTVVLVRSGDRAHDAAVLKALKDQDIDVSVVEIHQGIAAGYPMTTHEVKYDAPGPNGAPNPHDRKKKIDRARQRGQTVHPDEGMVWIDRDSGIFGPGKIAEGGTKEDAELFWKGWEKTHYEASSRTSKIAIKGRRQLLFDYAGKILLGDWRTWDIFGRDFNTGKHISDLIHRLQQEESIIDLVKNTTLAGEDSIPLVEGAIDATWVLQKLPPYVGSTRLLDQDDIITAINKLPDDPRALPFENDVEKEIRDAVYGEMSDKEVSAVLKKYHLAASRRGIIAKGYHAQNITIPPGDYKHHLIDRLSYSSTYSPYGFPTATERGLAQTASEWKPGAAIFYGGSQTSPGLVNNMDQLRRQGTPIIARVSAGKQNFVQARLTNLKARKVVQHKKEQMQIFGRYIHGERTIYINAEAYGNEDWRQLTLAFDGSKRYDSYQKIRAMNPEIAIRVHEEGHAVFYELSGPKLDKLSAVMRKVGHKIPGSAAVDPGEYFSDLYMLWVIDPETVAREYPDLAKFMGSQRGAVASIRKKLYSGKPGAGLRVERITKYTHEGETTILDPDQMTIPVHHVRETGAEPEELAVNTGSAGTLMGGIVNELEKDSSFFKSIGRGAKLDHKELDPVALWNQMPSKWDTVKRTKWMSKFYVPQWAAALTHHYAYSAIGKEILQGIADNRPIQDIASYVRRMLRENTGDLAARLNVDSRNLDDEVALRVEQIMTATMGDSRIASAALRAGRENNQSELLTLLNQVMTIDGAKNMPNISGLLPVPGEKGTAFIPKAIETYSRGIFETSTNKGSRQPYFHKAESDYKMALIGQAMANNEPMTVDTIQNIKMFARESAIADTWDLLFDFRRNSRLAEMMRLVIPFSQPFAEALVVWGRLIQKNPGFFHHLIQIGKTLQDYDVMIQEPDGSWNMKVPMIGPWLAALGQWTGNLVGVQSNVKFDNSQFNLVFPVSSLNFFLSSTIDVAGVPIPVPSASVPVTAFEQWLSGQSWVPDEAAAFLTKHAYQYGSVQTAGSFARAFLPRWMNTVVLPLLGVEDPQIKSAGQQFVSLMEDQGVTPDSLYSNKALAQSVAGRTFVDVTQAQKWFQDAADAQGRGFSIMRGFFGSIFPAPPNFHMPTYEADKYLTDLRARYKGDENAFDKVRTAFLKRYPELTSMLVASSLWAGTDIGTIKIPAFEGLSKIFNSQAADDIAKINPALVFALAPEEAWGETYDRVEYMKAIDQGWYATADIESFVGNWQTFEGWRAYNTATEERDKDIAAILADGTVDENGPEVQAVNEYFNNVTIPFMKEHNPAWAEEFHPSGGTFNAKFFQDIRRALKIDVFSTTSTGKAMKEYFTFRDAMKKDMAMNNLSGLENSVAADLGYTDKYDKFVTGLQDKYGLVFKLFFEEYVAGDLMDDSFLTHGEHVFNNLSKLGKETSDVVHANMGDWQLIQDRIGNYQPGSSDDPGSISVLYNNAKDQSNEWWDLYGASLKNPTWVWWETNTYSEKLSYKQSIAARPFTYLSTFDKEVVLGIPTTPETEAIWAQINYAQTNAQIIDDTGAVSDASIWYDEADRIAYQNLPNMDFATQLYYANTWGWSFFQATGYTQEGHASAEDWRAVQNLVQRSQQTANALEWSGTSDFDPLKKYGYVQLRSNLVAYIEERAKQSPMFAREYEDLVAAYNPFVDVLIPESYFLLGVDYDAQ